ncbi:MAG: NAD(P)-binding protein [Vicinamibacteria bacterium]
MTKRRRDPLGLDRAIPRRDFLNGLALGVGAAIVAPRDLLAAKGDVVFAPEKARGYYPPALTGLRGSTPGSFEAAHDLKDGFFEMTPPHDTGEEYDLVVVGAGISGLAAAHFFRKRNPRARVLLLDNHDDFGGHARRNEFRDGKRLYVTYGGTLAIDSPASYSAVAQGLIAELGIDVHRWDQVLDRKTYAGLEAATFFDRETFGADALVKGLQREQGGPDPKALAEAPLSAAVRQGIARLETEAFDPWPDLSSADKKARLLRTSYSDFLTKTWALDAGVLAYYRSRGYGLFGLGPDAISALDGWGLGFPGFQGLKLEPGYVQGMNRDAMREPAAEEYFFHYPDGNASVARLLVRALIPGAVKGPGGDAVVMGRADYARLDESGKPVRLRLNSTVVQARNAGGGVDVVYLRGGALQKVRARNCIMACWSAVVPHLVPGLPEVQQTALRFAVKVPLVYTSVFVRNWQAWKNLGVRAVSCPGSYWHSMRLDVPVNVGGFSCSTDPAQPIVVNLTRVPCDPGRPARDQHRAGRQELLDTPFEHMEKTIRDQMARVLGPGGFDPAKDIKAITVNRWPHGYAYQYNALFDSFWLEGKEAPCVRARQPFGRIFIANSDADAYAYTDSAIDQAHRAVNEALAG